ncbi:MAG: flavodoxin [Lachnospiraceae bacterium]|nr:flavodoxin [Lachnospiraceae bacterium]
MSKSLVLYFSASSGKVTEKVAKDLAAAKDADIFEIIPVEPYTEADIKYMNPLARCNKEWFGKKEVPAQGKIEDLSQYDTVYIGFPIWYGIAPLVVSTFLKDYDFTNIDVHVFATSGGSGIGKTEEKLRPYLKNVKSVDAKRIKSADEIQ